MSGSISDLEKDIEASRARLDETIDRIQDRLTAGSLVDELLGSTRRTNVNGLYDSALTVVRRNPVPVLLIAAGVSMLLSRMASHGRATPARPPLPDDRVPVRTGADRTYDPDQAGGHPVRDTLEDTHI